MTEIFISAHELLGLNTLQELASPEKACIMDLKF